MAIITDDDLRSHMSIDKVADDHLSRAVAAANKAVVRWCRRTFDKTAEASASPRVYRPNSWWRVYVDDFWSVTNLVVKTDDDDDGTFETTWAATDFVLEPLNGMENGATVPWYQIVAVDSGKLFCTDSVRPSVQVTAAWGWASVPDDVKEAALLKAARLYHRKDSPQGVAGFDQFGAVRLTRNDADVTDLLADFRYPSRMLV